MLRPAGRQVKFAASRVMRGAVRACYNARMPEHVWLVDRLGHPAVPLLVALDRETDAVVQVSLGANIGAVFRHARQQGARVMVERRRQTTARRQLGEYLLGHRRSFELPVKLLGTGFQRRAWEALAQIPYGRTASYAEQAASMQSSSVARAVGQANGRNPVPIVVPCHRVIGSSGKLVGFGGGLETKRWLLELEATGRVPSWVPRTDPPAARQLGLFDGSAS